MLQCVQWWYSIKNTVQRTGTLGRLWTRSKSVSVFIKYCILENEHRNPITNRVHAHTKDNGRAKYEQGPWNIVGYRVVKRVRRTDGRTDGQTAQGTTIPCGPNGLRLKCCSNGCWKGRPFNTHSYVEMNAVARAQLAFQMLTLLEKYLYHQSQY